jgi:hypothetical protein
MYQEEVLGKRVVVQHLWLEPWEEGRKLEELPKSIEELEKERNERNVGIQPSMITPAPWTTTSMTGAQGGIPFATPAPWK